MNAMANVTPIIATIKNAGVKEKTLKEADVVPKASILDFCEEHYEDILPIIMDKACPDKQKEVQTRLDFGESSRKIRRERENSLNSRAAGMGDAEDHASNAQIGGTLTEEEGCTRGSGSSKSTYHDYLVTYNLRNSNNFISLSLLLKMGTRTARPRPPETPVNLSSTKTRDINSGMNTQITHRAPLPQKCVKHAQHRCTHAAEPQKRPT
ncbi:hypothetical protein Tco_1354377 [Tanacetum coccineum]